MKFEWDPRKAEANLRKHGVSFDEGASVFHDPLALSGQTPITPSAKIGSSPLVNPALATRSRSTTLTDPVLFAFQRTPHDARREETI